MANQGIYPSNSEAAVHGPKSNLGLVITEFLDNTPSSTPKEMDDTSRLISGAWRETEATNDYLNICIDLAARIPNATFVVAEMFRVNHEGIPARWRDPDNSRGVLSMVGEIEAGILRAQQAVVIRGGEIPGLAERITRIEEFIRSMQGR